MSAIVSYAQNFEDVLLWRLFQDVGAGFYVDVGAQDPVVDSVSAAFFERGWHGVHVEPASFYAARLRAARPGDVVLQAAIAEKRGVLTFYEVDGSGLSTLDPGNAEGLRDDGYAVGETAVPTLTLSDVFDVCPDEVHWLKIDVEGSERNVLESWGEHPRRPLVVVVESTLPRSKIESHGAWEHLLSARGYTAAHFDGLNRYFVLDSERELIARMAAPANVFDGFTLSATGSSSFHEGVRSRVQFELSRAESAWAEIRSGLDSQVEQARADHVSAVALLALEKSRAGEFERALRHEIEDARADEALAHERFRAVDELRRAAEASFTHAADTLTRERDAIRSAGEAAISALKATHLGELERQRADFAEAAIQRTESLRDQLRADHRAELERSALSFAEQGARLASIDLQLQATRRAIEGFQHSWWGRIGAALGKFVHVVSVGVAHEDITQRNEAAVAAPQIQEDRFVIEQMLTLNGKEFVLAAYRAVLKREPDPAGEQSYLELLRTGHDKLHLIADMSASDEGRRVHAAVPGLDRALRLARLRRVPFLGLLLTGVRRMLRPARDLDSTHAYRSQSIELQFSIIESLKAVQAAMADLQQRQATLEAGLRRIAATCDEPGSAGYSSNRTSEAAIGTRARGLDTRSRLVQQSEAWRTAP